MSNFNNYSALYESIYEAIKASKKKVLNVEYLTLSGGGIFTFDWWIDDDYDIDELTDEVLMVIKSFDANHIKIFDPETKEIVYEVACLCGGADDLNTLVAQGILENPNIPEYFKKFISLKLQLIELINSDPVRIAELYRTKRKCEKNGTPNPFLASTSFVGDERIFSALLAVQEIIASKVDGAIFTNEEYEFYIKAGHPSWLISDAHCEWTCEIPEDHVTVEDCFYKTAKMHLDCLAEYGDSDEDEDDDEELERDDL